MYKIESFIYRMLFISMFLILSASSLMAKQIFVSKDKITSINSAIALANDGDSIIVNGGVYKEGNIIIKKRISLIGINLPVIDGEMKSEIISIKRDSVIFKGFKVMNSGYSTLDDPCGIKVYESKKVIVENNELYNNFFGIYLQYCTDCTIINNKITAFGEEEQKIGNGIHCWKSDNIRIIGNDIKGHRDGIYFEFVTHSLIWRNISTNNVRYGLHFMFSNDDSYIANIFSDNGAGVAVMFTKHVLMYNNIFKDNWGDSSYGILLKEISDAEIIGNIFTKNTSALYLEGASRMKISNNTFNDNGWGMKIQASCMDNVITNNNFTGNTFDISTNGSLVLNTFNNNYWDKYEGYDLDRNNIGDVPYHPLSLFSKLSEANPIIMILYRSFVVLLLDKSEKMIPSIMPNEFVDNEPVYRKIKL